MSRDYRDIGYLRQYVDGKLSEQEMYDLERAAHHDEMLMDTLLGLEYEKSQHAPNNIEDIRQRIRARVRQSPAVVNLQWSRWAVAVSLIVAVALATAYFVRTNRLSGPELAEVSEGSIGVDTLKNADSGGNMIAMTEDSQTNGRLELSDPAEVPTQVITNAETPSDDLGSREESVTSEIGHDESVIASRQATVPELVEEVTVIGKGQSLDSASVTSQPSLQRLAYQDSQIRPGEGSLHGALSVARTRAHVNSMKIDPQTTMILNRAQDEQERDLQQYATRMEDSRIEIKVREENYKYLAHMKSADSVSRSLLPTIESEPTRTLNSDRYIYGGVSIPIGGWKAFDNYIGKFLNGKAIKSGFVTYAFRLDDDGQPVDIRITNASHPGWDKIFVELLENGPKWQLGTDSLEVRLDLTY